MGRASEINPIEIKQAKMLKKDNKAFQEQLVKDLEKQRMISDSQRRYLQCSQGKCTPIMNEQAKAKRRLMLINKKINFLSKGKHDRNLRKIFIEKGRIKRIKELEKDVNELNLKLNAARGKLYLKENEENLKKIIENLELQKGLLLEIEKAKTEISHIKSQFERLDSKMEELKKSTESEMKFAEHLKKANRQLEIYENRVQNSRNRECLATVENERLRNLIKRMIYDRAYFNKNWSTMLKKLKDRKKFLLDMIEKANQGFSQDSDFMDNLKQLTNRRAQDHKAAVAEITKMKRQIDANQIMSDFLGGKGKIRHYAPLLDKEIKRKENEKRYYTEKVNLYRNIVMQVKKIIGDDTEINDLSTSNTLKLIDLIDNNSFQFYNYLNEIASTIEIAKARNNKDIKSTNSDIEKRDTAKKYFEKKIQECHTTLHHEIERTLEIKNYVEKFDSEMNSYYNTLKEIGELINCDFESVNSKLGNPSRVYSSKFLVLLQSLENRFNEMLAFVYCNERDGMDILTKGKEEMIIKSVKRTDNEPFIKIDDVILTSECPECGELEDVNRFDSNIVEVLDEKDLKNVITEKYKKPELESRMHNLLSCNLPRSGIVASRRYAE